MKTMMEQWKPSNRKEAVAEYIASFFQDAEKSQEVFAIALQAIEAYRIASGFENPQHVYNPKQIATGVEDYADFKDWIANYYRNA